MQAHTSVAHGLAPNSDGHKQLQDTPLFLSDTIRLMKIGKKKKQGE